MEESNQKGMPIYLDPTSRKIVTAGEKCEEAKAWYPSTPVSRRLWTCLEILRDINDLLEDGVAVKSSGKRKRRAKIIAGQVHSLAKAVNELCKTIIGDRSIRKQMGKESVKQVQKVQEDFSNFVPFQWNSELSNYRNKLVAHFDDDFWPRDASELLNSIPTYKIGYWLHICLHVTLDLTKLDIYSWSCDSVHKDYVRFMTNEPFIVTFKMDNETNKFTSLAGVDIANESPRQTVQEIIGQAIKLSQWLFKKGQPRIRSLQEDSKDKWNTFSDTKSIYAAEI